MLLSHRFWLGLIVSIGFLFLFLWKIDFGETGRELRDANYIYFIPAVLIYFGALGFRSLRWRYLLLHIKPIHPRSLFPVVAIGYMSNNVLPIRLGELVRAHFLGEKEKVNKASALATIAVERVFDGLTLLLFAAVIWPFLPWTDVLRNDAGDLKLWWIALSVIVATAFVAGFLVLFIFASSPRLANRMTGMIALLAPRRFRPKVKGIIDLLIEGLGALRSPRKLMFISFLSFPVWLTEAAMYYILAVSFGLDQPFQVILLVTATSNLATAVPSSIGGIGPFEVVAKSTLVAVGVGAEVAAAYAFSVHIIALWLPVNILGLVFLWKENLSLSEIARTRQIDLASAGARDLSPPAG